MAVHFKDKNDPGSTVCSGKVYANTGGSSIKERMELYSLSNFLTLNCKF